MNLRFAALTVVLAAGHFLTFLFLLLAVWGTGFAEKDTEGSALADSIVYQAMDRACLILAYPGAALWTPWMSANLPDAAEWALCLANSLLWGWVAALLIRRVLRLASKPRLDGSAESRPSSGAVD